MADKDSVSTPTQNANLEKRLQAAKSGPKQPTMKGTSGGSILTPNKRQ